MTYVYIYRDENLNPFYIGIGTGYRAWNHLKPSSYMPFDSEYPSFYGKIKKMKLLNLEPKIEIIFEGSRNECETLERRLIIEYGLLTEGGMLYNVSKNTGGRIKGKKYPMTDNTLKRYKESCRKNRKFLLDETEIRNLYISQNMTREQLAEHFGCSTALVKSRLKEYNIVKQYKNKE